MKRNSQKPKPARTFGAAVNTRVDDATHRALGELATITGMSIADLARRILQDAIADGWSPVTSMQRRTERTTTTHEGG